MFFTNSHKKTAMDLLDELGKTSEETPGTNAEQYEKSDGSFFVPETKETVTSLKTVSETDGEEEQEENGQQTLLPLLEKTQDDAEEEAEEEIEVITEDEKAKRTERYELLTGFMQHDANVCAKETILEHFADLQKKAERLRKKLGYPGIGKKLYSFPAFTLDLANGGLTVADREATDILLGRWRRTFLERPGAGTSVRFELAEAITLLLEQESKQLKQAVG